MSVLKDGVPFATLEGGAVAETGGRSAVRWADGVLRVTTPLAGEETFVVVRQEGKEKTSPGGAHDSP